MLNNIAISSSPIWVTIGHVSDSSSVFDELDKIEDLIRKGSSAEAQVQLRDLIEQLNKAKDSRAALAKAAQLCRRAGLSSLSLKLLSRYVRPPSKQPVDATAQEKAEYAAALNNIGASREAIEILKAIDAVKNPQALLYLAWAHMSQWEYELCIPLLLRYCSLPSVDKYTQIVGRVNLAACYVGTHKLSEAETLLAELTQSTSEGQYHLLHANVLELLAQCFILQKNFSKARSVLKQAAERLPDKKVLSYLYIRKWEAVIELEEKGFNEDAIEKLRAIKQEALERNIWETLRDCDHYLARAERSRELFEYLYFGTPYVSYRSDLLKEFQTLFGRESNVKQKNNGGAEFPPPRYFWNLGIKSIKNLESLRKTSLLKIVNGENTFSSATLKVGQLTHKLLVFLARDFYRPQRIASIHSEIFPDRYYDVKHSPQVIQQHIIRLRQWFKSNGIPLDVIESESFYSLSATAPCAIEIPLSSHDFLAKADDAKVDYNLDKIREAFGDAEFNSAQVATLLEISLVSAKRLVSAAYDNGKLKRIGKGPKTAYRF